MMKWLTLTAATALLTGCVPTRDADLGGRDTAAHGLTRVDVHYQRGQAGEATLDAQAYFVRFRGVDDNQVPTLLGFGPSRPSGTERCVSIDDKVALDRALASRAATAEVELLDAGHLELRAGDVRLPLDTRHYPELVPGVAGTVYGATGSLPTNVVLGAVHTLSSDGGTEVGPFSVTVTAPAAFPDGAIDRTTMGVRLRWTPTSSGTAERLIDVELRPNGRRSSRAIHCQLPDTLGSYVVPNAVLAALGASLPDLQVTLRHRQNTHFEIPQLGRAELNLELRETLRVGAIE